MSGTCSAHKHYERDCPRCQTEKPEWVQALEAEVAALKAKAAEAIAVMRDEHPEGDASCPGCAALARYDALAKEETP